MSQPAAHRARVVAFEEIAETYAAAFDPSVHAVFSSPQWLGALPRGSVRVAVFDAGASSAFLPVTVGRRRGVPLVGNPAMTPWIEIVGGSSGSKRSAIIGDVHTSGAAIALALRRLGVVRLRLQRSSPSWLGFHWAGYIGNARISYVLGGSSSDAWSAMKGKTRTAIRASARNGLLVRPVNPAELNDVVSLFTGHAASKGFVHALRPEQLRTFVAETERNGLSTVRGAFDAEGDLVGAAFFADDQRTRTYLIGAQNANGNRVNAMAGLLWSAIEETLDGGKTFDFEGSMLRGVEEFVRAFGGEQFVDVTVVWIPRPHGASVALRRVLSR